VHAEVAGHAKGRLILIEISPRGHRYPAAPDAADRQGGCAVHRVSATTLSFDKDETSYKSLKAILDGGLEGRPDKRGVLRHLQSPPHDAAPR